MRDKLDFAFEDLGEQHVKSIARPVRVYRVRDPAIPIEQSSLISPQPLPLPNKPDHDETFVFGSFRLIPAQRMLLDDGKPLRLGSRALDILLALVESAGETIPKDQLIARTWPDTVVDEGALRVHVAALRKALGDGRAGRRYVANNPGRGYAFVAPVTREHARPDPASADGAADVNNLPAPLTRIVGRDDTIAGLATQLGRRRFLTIVGAGGIGKTTVAVAVADAVRASYKDGAWFVGLASLANPDLVPSALGAALGIPPSGADPLRGLAAWLRDKTALIVLDSCEHIIDAAAALAEAVLKAAPGVSILTTSREPLRAEGESLHRLTALELPSDSVDLAAGDALRYSAVQLFNERAMAAVDGFALADADVPAVLEICRRLDGIPLALELAAARVDVFGVRELGGASRRSFPGSDERPADRSAPASDARRCARLELSAAPGRRASGPASAQRVRRRFRARRRGWRGRRSSRAADHRPHCQPRRQIAGRRRSSRRGRSVSSPRHHAPLRLGEAQEFG